MKINFKRFVMTLALLLTALSSAVPAQTQPRVVRGASSLRLESERTTYMPSQPVRVRCWIENTTSFDFAVLWLSPWHMIVLEVKDANGDVVSPNVEKMNPSEWNMPVATLLTPHVPEIVRGTDRKDWVDISNWGYGPLKPGAYTITGTLRTAVHLTSGQSGTQNNTEVDRFTNESIGNTVAITVAAE